ncbi:MAG: hypothetical protein J4F50_08785 [Acidimicrobiia bacterium]|nr:hypothetical protein [Acidimicrobiia bacterium]
MENGEGSDPGVGLEPEAVEETDFATVRRGYEPGPVRARLREAAEEIRRLNTLVGSLSNRIAELEETPPEVLESRRVAEALGDEATRILQSASDAAQERIERAEAECARIVGEAQETAAASIEDGREQGRSMVLEARNVRERILADLAGKRREYQVEVEQLREVHDRLTEALGIFRQGLDGWIDELVQAGPRAAAAAERAGLRVAAQPESTVAQIEAEIGTARLAGMPLDGPLGEEARDGDEAPAPDAADTDDMEPESPQGVGEPEAVGDSVAIAGLTLEPSPGTPGAPAPLYDIEAEADVELDDGADLSHGQASDVVDDVADDMASDVAGDAGAIFARLRSVTAQPVSESPEPAPADEGAPPEPAGVAGEPAEFADEFEEDFADEHEAAAEPSDPDDLVSAARAVAVGGIARRLKRLVVDEQGDLLDGIRRNGVRAVRSAIAGDTKGYTRAARVPMQDFASDIDVSIDDIDLTAAGAAILSVLVEPVRARLGDLMEETDDADELSRAVRSIYRESRSRRADVAAESAFSAGWPEPIT